MAGLRTYYRTHLEKALEAEEPSEKDFHIRQALQAAHDTAEEPASNEQRT